MLHVCDARCSISLFVKELKDYDFSFQPNVNEQEMRELASLGFLEKNENIVFLGPSGVE